MIPLDKIERVTEDYQVARYNTHMYFYHSRFSPLDLSVSVIENMVFTTSSLPLVRDYKNNNLNTYYINDTESLYQIITRYNTDTFVQTHYTDWKKTVKSSYHMISNSLLRRIID